MEYPQDRPIRKLSRHYSDATILMHQAIAKKAGLSGTDHKYLGMLIEKGPMTAGALGQLTGLSSGAVTGLADRLEKKKLVKRKFDKIDRRKIMIVPDIERAMKLLGPTFQVLQQKTEAVIGAFTEEEIKAVEKYFRLTIEVMNEFTHQLHKE